MTLTKPLAEIVMTATGLVVTQGMVQAHLSRAEIASLPVEPPTGGIFGVKGLILTGEQLVSLHRPLASTPRRFQWVTRHV